MTSPSAQPPKLDRLLSDPTRLTIMSVLCAAEWCDFAFLRDAVSLSDSALSKQLATLRKEEYVEQRRTYIGRVPKTTVQATDQGRHRFLVHVEALQMIVDRTPRPADSASAVPEVAGDPHPAGGPSGKTRRFGAGPEPGLSQG
jgi:DNA-binding transcriptional ArsR family regulator